MPLIDLYRALDTERRKVIVGQRWTFDLLLVALLTDGHVLIEGVPGVAKTLMARTLATTLKAEFKRVQFTPDLMPSDVIGTNVFDFASSTFSLRQGPVFTNIPLPEAQLDRFLFKVLVDYPSHDEGLQVLKNYQAGFNPRNLATLGVQPVAGPEDLKAVRQEIAAVKVADAVLDDIQLLVPPVMRHRIILKPEAEIEGVNPDRALERILGRVEVPR